MMFVGKWVSRSWQLLKLKGKLNMSSSTIGDIPSVAYIFDKDLEKETNKIQPIANRISIDYEVWGLWWATIHERIQSCLASIVHNLIDAYGLLSHMKCLPSRLATDAELLSFHSSTYLEYIASAEEDGGNAQCNNADDEETDGSDDDHAEMDNEFGIGNQVKVEGLYLALILGGTLSDVIQLKGYDCPKIKNMKTFVSRLAGGTLAAVDAILNGQAKVAINWCGGWHHAQRDQASGFCYVNDIVIGIQKLQTAFSRILYVDLDCHHGDGVENAFSYTRRVFTLSVHNYEPGYFPGTGSMEDVGSSRAKYYAANIPLKSGISDKCFVDIIKRSVKGIVTHFRPDMLVLQCGADNLSYDPLGNSNLSEIGMASCINFLLEFKLPTLCLGGGGYNIPNVAKCWTHLTSVIVGKSLLTDIPEHEFFPLYGPDFDLHITPSFLPDNNSIDYVSSLLMTLEENLKKLDSSVQHDM